jgi:putative hydrolase of the HAD superfamily
MAGVTDVRAVLFDADGVLQRAVPGWKANLEALVAPGRAEEFLAEVMLSERGPLRGESSFRDELAKVLTRWNVTAPLDEVLANWTRIEVFPDMVEVVRELRATGTACYLATNQQAFRTAYMRANLGYDDLLDGAFYSCELGLAKPDPAYFGTILERIGRTGAQTLFIDDNESNVEGARAAGLHAEHFPPDAGAIVLRELLTRYSLPR